MKKRTLIAIVLFTSATFFINQIALQAKEAKKVSAVGTKIMVSSDLLPYLGALTFIAPQEAQHPRPKVHGMTKQNELSRIDGHNHDLVGELVSASQQSEGIPGITTNVDKNQLLIQKVAVDGTPVDVQYETDYVDIPALVDYLKDQADITITRDTVYKGGNIGSKEDPKVVIVDAARLKLMHDFEGYGILVLTGERKDNPRWDDELTADDIDSDKSTLYNNLRQIATELELDFPKEQRARRRLRLVMEDTSSWYGMIISDIGAETRAEAVIDREINVPEADSIDIKKGRRTDPAEEEDLRDEWEEEERQSPSRGMESFRKDLKELFAGLFETKLAYAKNKNDEDDGKERTKKGKKVKEQDRIVYSKEKIKYAKPVWHRHGAQGVVIMLGRQHGYWHPPYPWPAIKEDLLPDSPKRKWIDNLQSSIKNYIEGLKGFFISPAYAKQDQDDDDDNGNGNGNGNGNNGNGNGNNDDDDDDNGNGNNNRRRLRRIKPQAGDGVKVYGAMLIGGDRPMVIMKLADVFYSKEAVAMVDKKLSSLRFVWGEFKEER